MRMQATSYIINDKSLDMPVEVSIDEANEGSSAHYVVTQGDQLVLLTAEAARQLFRAICKLEKLNA